MIQPINPPNRAAWHVSWIDLDEPLPTPNGFFLPTIVIVTDQRGVPLGTPEFLEELDQFRVEQLLSGLIDQLGTPECITLAESDDWDTAAWEDFSHDFRVRLDFTRPGSRSAKEIDAVSAHVTKLGGDHPHSRLEIAAGLVSTARRVRSMKKREALLKKAANLDPENANAAIELADLQMRDADWKGALAAYESLISREQGRWADTRARWWENAETRPYLRAIFGRSMALWHLGRYHGAGETLADLVEINPVDHQGARFLIGLVRLLDEDYEGAADAYAQYTKSYPDDFDEASHAMGRGLTNAYFSRDSEACIHYRAGILKNIYIAPLLLDLPSPDETIWVPGDRADPTYAREFYDSYAVLWDRVPSARRTLREAWEKCADRIREIVAHRRAMLEFQDQRYDPEYKTKWDEMLRRDEALSDPRK